MRPLALPVYKRLEFPRLEAGVGLQEPSKHLFFNSMDDFPSKEKHKPRPNELKKSSSLRLKTIIF